MKLYHHPIIFSDQWFCILRFMWCFLNLKFYIYKPFRSALVLETNLKVSYYFALLISSYLCFSRNSAISPSYISHSNFLLLICYRILIISSINLFLGMQVALPAKYKHYQVYIQFIAFAKIELLQVVNEKSFLLFITVTRVVLANARCKVPRPNNYDTTLNEKF